VPIVICGLQTHVVAADQGLWVRKPDSEGYVRLDQSSSSHDADFWQINFDRATDTYEIIYNIEFLFDGNSVTMVGFGTNPDTWPTQCNATVANAQNSSEPATITSIIDEVVTVVCNDGYETLAKRPVIYRFDQFYFYFAVGHFLILLTSAS
jgi:hypothetical protein